MSNVISLNFNELHNFKQAMRGTMSGSDAELMAIKAMALCSLYDDLDNQNAIATAFNQAENDYPQAFVGGAYGLSNLADNPALIAFITYLNDSKQKGIFNFAEKRNWLSRLLETNHTQFGGFKLDSSLNQFLTKLLAKTAGKNLYLPYEISFYESLHFIENYQVFAEGETNPAILYLIALILDNVQQYTNSNPAFNPAYVQNGQLQQFDVGLLLNGWRRPNHNQQQGIRFTDAGISLPYSLIQHSLLQVNGLLITLVPTNVLTALISRDVQMRQWLVDCQHLKAVVAFPSFFMTPRKSFALMIFDTKNYYDDIMMINLNLKDDKNRREWDTNHFIKNGEGWYLDNFDDLIGLIDRKIDNPCGQIVDKETIANHNFSLSPERYVLDEGAKQALAVFGQSELVKINNLANIIRPADIRLLKSVQTGDIKVVEVQGGDLPEFGYIEVASKENMVDNSVLQKFEPYFLQRHDIIITVRGSVGKVGIVSQELLDKYEGRVLAGQTSVVLRSRDNGRMHPIALFMQLNDKLTQSRLQLISSGASVASLSVRDLTEFEVVAFSQKRQDELVEIFCQQRQIIAHIAEQQAKLQALANGVWG